MRKYKPARLVGEVIGILNADGDFWTHNTFENPRLAEEYLRAFFPTMTEEALAAAFSIVPVEVTLVRIGAGRRFRAQAIDARSGETEGLDPKGESAVGNADAPMIPGTSGGMA